MLSLNQVLLIKRLEAYSKSVFSKPEMDFDGRQKIIFLASDTQFAEWLTIPSSKIAHLSHIKIQTLMSDCLSASYLDFITDKDSKRLNILPLSSGEVVTPPLCAGNPS